MVDNQNNLPRLREAGEVHRSIMEDVRGIIVEDFAHVSTGDIDSWIDDQIQKRDMQAAFKTVPGYEFASCISVNGTVVHGLPNDYVIQPGDYVTVDFGVSSGGYIVDAADTWIVGEEKQDDLILAAKDVRGAMLSRVVAGARVMDLAQAVVPLMPQLAAQNMYVLPDFAGHGVRRHNLHSIPCIPSVPVNVKMPTKDWEHQCLRERYTLQEGDVICIEPIIVRTNKPPKKGLRYGVAPDGWTVKLQDKAAIAVHVEHEVVVTKGKPEILA
jgi:methionyl aminopeptidase